MNLDLQALIEEAKARAEAHTASCELPTCQMCDRSECLDCGSRTPFDYDRCDACSAKLQRGKLLERWRSAIPKAHHGAHLQAEWLAELVSAPVLHTLPEHPGRMTLAGPAGTGKTSLAVALLRREFGRRASCAFVQAYELGKARAHHRLGDGEAPLVHTALTVGALVIDELGSEQPAHTPTVAEVIHARHAEALTTIVTTGLTSETLAGRYGDGIRRRLTEGAHVVTLRRDPK